MIFSLFLYKKLLNVDDEYEKNKNTSKLMIVYVAEFLTIVLALYLWYRCHFVKKSVGDNGFKTVLGFLFALSFHFIYIIKHLIGFC